MNLTTSLTDRDKKLLVAISVVAFLFVYINFALMPALTNHDTATAALSSAEEYRDEVEYNLALAGAAALDAENTRTELNAAVAAFYPLMENQALDTLVTSLALQHNLEPLSLTISSVTNQNLSGYVYSASAGVTAGGAAPTPAPVVADESSDTTADTAADALVAAAGATSNYIYVAQLDCSARGSRADFTGWLDDLQANYPAIQLLSFSIRDTTSLSVADGAQTSSEFSYSLAIYMCSKESELD